MKRLFLGIILLCVLASCADRKHPALFELEELKDTDDGRSALVSSAEARINAEILKPGESVRAGIPFPEGVSNIVLEPISPEDLALPKGQAAWRGQFDDGGDAFVMLIRGEFVEAQFERGARVYRLRSIDAKRGRYEVFDAPRFREAPNDGVVSDRERLAGDEQPDSACEDPANRIDTMVLYTPAARDAAGSVLAVENEIAFAVGRTNLANANSNVSHRINLIHTGVVSYTEPAGGVDSNALLGDLRATADGVLDSIHGLRDGQKADLVSLIYEVDDGDWCGWGYNTETADADTTDDDGFSVVQRSCAGGYLSFAHETGHNIGAKHDRANASGTLDFNFGHIQPQPSTDGVAAWRTVMAYNSPCKDSADEGTCSRIAYFSNPDVSFSGDPTGVALTAAEPEHNVQVFVQNDGEVSRYRCLRSAGDANVWMKDRWEDQGGEPDPATAGKSMWQSPYIWVRLSEDTALEHEHEHDNPTLGQTNHVYVKIHNDGGASQSGNLELYFASASTNLNDPANWSSIGSQAQTLSPSVNVFGFEWNDLPGTGHYCLLARWNEDGTPLAFTDLNASVRNDNDLVWRNVYIVNLGGDPQTDNAFQMAGDRRAIETYLFIETKPMSRRNIPWPDLARAELIVGENVLNENALVSEGLNRANDRLFEVPLAGAGKILGPFKLEPGEETKIILRVTANDSAVKETSAQLANRADFEVTASQVRPDALPLLKEDPTAAFNKEGLVIGGVTFTLRVPPGE